MPRQIEGRLISVVAALLATVPLATAVAQGPRAAQQPQRAGSVVFVPPPGWQRSAQGDVVIFTPVNGDPIRLYVPPGEVLTQALDRWFQLRWDNLGRSVPLLGTGEIQRGTASGNDLRLVLGATDDGTRDGMPVLAIAAARGVRVQPVIVVARDWPTFERHRDDLFRSSWTLRVLAPADQGQPRPEPYATMVNAAAGAFGNARFARPRQAAARVAGALDGLYVGQEIEPSYSDVPTSPPEKFVVFFPDGTFLDRLPQEGLAGLDPTQSREEYGSRWGTYRVQGQRIVLRYDGGSRDRVGEVRSSGQLVIPGFGRLVAVPKLNGLVLDGLYVPQMDTRGAEAPPILFRRDGTFEDRGATNTLRLAWEGRPQLYRNPPGSGTYRIADNTLTLTYGDGRVVPVAVYVLGRTADAIFLNRRLLRRTR